jgi:predicted transcriptional regulator
MPTIPKIRKHLLNTITEYPGITITSIVRHHGITKQSAAYHLSKMVKTGQIVKRRIKMGLSDQYYPADHKENKFIDLINRPLSKTDN